MQLEAYVDLEKNCGFQKGIKFHAASLLDYHIYAVSTLQSFAPNLDDMGDCSSEQKAFKGLIQEP